MKALPLLLASGAITLLALAPRAAEAAPNLALAAKNLLAARGFSYAPAAVSGVVLDAIDLEKLEDGKPTALSWAIGAKSDGRMVLVPSQLVDGKDHPYDGSGLPTSVVALLPADGADLLKTGLYVEVAS